MMTNPAHHEFRDERIALSNNRILKNYRTVNRTVIDDLRLVVSDTYALIAQTHLCQWSVRSRLFFSLHAAFEAQYNELFSAVDELGARIRAKGGLAPRGFVRLAEMAGIEEITEDSTAKEMVNHLVNANEKLLTDSKGARERARKIGDAETEKMMIARTQVHKKTDWLLRSFLE